MLKEAKLLNETCFEFVSTAKDTVISPNFLVYGKAQFPYSFGRIAVQVAIGK